jgi:hypothetical protein
MFRKVEQEIFQCLQVLASDYISQSSYPTAVGYYFDSQSLAVIRTRFQFIEYNPKVRQLGNVIRVTLNFADSLQDAKTMKALLVVIHGQHRANESKHHRSV